ncbi:hypothetical protein FO519_007048 [Halicephalobus sp. NKZ332]|nr:hypothetical protein FO519_007048 [Halicephalobus sp. NKZ332]
MQIFVNGLDGAVVKLDAEYDTSIGEIKEFIEAKDAILSFGSKILDIDSATLGALEIPDEATINVNVRLLGGKVHGSLARAGRAFRRLQYTRRFVNVAVQGPGRKRGPNSNMA